MKLDKHLKMKHKIPRPRPNIIFVCCLYTMHELCNHERFPYLSSSIRRKQLLCFVHSQGKNIQKKNFVRLHNHFHLLTMTTVISPDINDLEILSYFSCVIPRYISQDDAGFLYNVFFCRNQTKQKQRLWT